MVFQRITDSSTAVKLFTGYDEFYFVSFATSLRSLLKLIETNNFKKVEGVIGENVTDRFREDLGGDIELVSSIVG